VFAHIGVHSNAPLLHVHWLAMQVLLAHDALVVRPHGIAQPVGIGPVQPGSPHSAVQQPGSSGVQPAAQSEPR
jgi:hypothetical protein